MITCDANMLNLFLAKKDGSCLQDADEIATELKAGLVTVDEQSDADVHGRFEFVLKRGGKRVHIIAVKRFDLCQGIAQKLVGLEALADVINLT